MRSSNQMNLMQLMNSVFIVWSDIWQSTRIWNSIARSLTCSSMLNLMRDGPAIRIWKVIAAWYWHWVTLVFQSCTRARSRKWSLGRLLKPSYFCLYSGVDLALYYRRIGQFMRIPDPAPLPVYQDNTSSMKIATMGHGSSTSNTKFMDLKFQ